MTEARLPLVELLENAGETDFLRAVAEAVLQLLSKRCSQAAAAVRGAART